ncbi:MAG: hypothetical protein R6U98_32060 [Pirellulaceae bacterium]
MRREKRRRRRRTVQVVIVQKSLSSPEWWEATSSSGRVSPRGRSLAGARHRLILGPTRMARQPRRVGLLVRLAELADGDMRMDSRGTETGMAEEGLDVTDVRAPFGSSLS